MTIYLFFFSFSFSFSCLKLLRGGDVEWEGVQYNAMYSSSLIIAILYWVPCHSCHLHSTLHFPLSFSIIFFFLSKQTPPPPALPKFILFFLLFCHKHPRFLLPVKRPPGSGFFKKIWYILISWFYHSCVTWYVVVSLLFLFFLIYLFFGSSFSFLLIIFGFSFRWDHHSKAPRPGFNRWSLSLLFCFSTFSIFSKQKINK